MLLPCIPWQAQARVASPRRLAWAASSTSLSVRIPSRLRFASAASWACPKLAWETLRLDSVRSFSCSSTCRMTCAPLATELKAPNGLIWEQPQGLFINNEFVSAGSGRLLATVNPYTEHEICSVHVAGAGDVDKAVSSARRALKDPSWAMLSGTDRGHLMTRLADLVDQHRGTLASIETLDNGKPYSVSLGFDVPHFSEVLRYYAGYADKNFGKVIDVGPEKMAYTLKQPVGVCGQIIPWNYPLDMAAWKLGPALCCGNTVVLKLAEQTPLSMLYVAKLIREAGFPPGVINIINGYGAEAGAALVRHPDVDKIAFTGSTATGKDIMRMAAATMKAITLETGGKSPLIVFDDADLEQAVRWAHAGIMENQGQVCTATSRLLVQSGVYDKFLDAFTAYVEKASIVGDPFDPTTFQGPQVTRAQRDRVMSYISGARESGATVFHPSDKLPSRGFFAPPTVLTGLQRSAPAFQDEIFGPCAVVTRFDTESEALAVANDTRYGLAGAVFTRDLSRAHRMARDLEAGMVWVNSSNDSDVRVPFGGVKESGLGRELGEEGLRGYYNIKAVHVNLSSR